jgi:hypothetical protein
MSYELYDNECFTLVTSNDYSDTVTKFRNTFPKPPLKTNKPISQYICLILHLNF